jgi:hypothetical protein
LNTALTYETQSRAAPAANLSLLSLPAELLNQIMQYALTVPTIFICIHPARQSLQYGHCFRCPSGIVHPFIDLLGITAVCQQLYCYREWPIALNVFELWVDEIRECINLTLVPIKNHGVITEIRVRGDLRSGAQHIAPFDILGVLPNLRKVTLISPPGGHDFSHVPAVVELWIEKAHYKKVEVTLEIGDVKDIAAGPRSCWVPRT